MEHGTSLCYTVDKARMSCLPSGTRADKEVSHMDRGMKKWIYWGAYVFLTLAGFLACIFRLLPVVTPSVFLPGPV